MAIRSICEKDQGILRKKSKKVEQINDKIIQLLDDLKDTLMEADGIGLAAPQVGILKRIAIIDSGEEVIELINPVITEREGEQVYLEGCLSVPGMYGNVGRPEKVTVIALNRDGEEMEYQAEGLLAVAFCHEIDHLDGVMFTDKVKGKLYSIEELNEMEKKNENDEKTKKNEISENTEKDVE